MRWRNRLVLGFLFLPATLWAQSATSVKKHPHWGLGLAHLQFLDELKTFHGPAYVLAGSYLYTFDTPHSFDLDIGADLVYYESNQDAFINHHFAAAPHYRQLWPMGKGMLGYLLGLEVDYWRQTFRRIGEDILHDDTLYNFRLGGVYRYRLSANWHGDVSLLYHLQEFSFNTPYLSLAVMFYWHKQEDDAKGEADALSPAVD